MHRRRFLLGLAGLPALGLATLPAGARAFAGTDYPSRNVRLIVPAAPGGSADKLARTISQKLDGRWPHRLIVENAGGGGGTVGAIQVVKAAADGYTLLHGTDSLSLNAAQPEGLPFSPTRDLSGVAKAIVSPMLLLVRPSLGVKTYEDFIALAKARPGEISVGLPAGNGSLQHLAISLLARRVGVRFNTVPYPGGGPAMLDTIGGHIDALIITLPAATENIRAGNLTGLAVTTPYRSKALPEVPTLQELGVPDFSVEAWQGVFAPAGTPRPAIDKLNADLAAVLKQAEVAAPLEEQGFEIAVSSPEDLDRFLVAEGVKYRQIAADAGIKLR